MSRITLRQQLRTLYICLAELRGHAGDNARNVQNAGGQLARAAVGKDHRNILTRVARGLCRDTAGDTAAGDQNIISHHCQWNLLN